MSQPPPQDPPQGWGQQPPGPPGPPGPVGQGPGGPPPAGFQPPAKGGSKTGLIILVAVLVVAVLGAGAFVLLSGDDDNDDDAPVAAVERMLDAGSKDDCAALIETVTEETWSRQYNSREEAISGCEDAVAEGNEALPGGLTVENLKVESQEGDKAVVSGDFVTDGETESGRIPVVKENGKWVVDLVGLMEDLSGGASGE